MDFSAADTEVFTSAEEYDPFVEFRPTTIAQEAVEEIVENSSFEQE